MKKCCIFALASILLLLGACDQAEILVENSPAASAASSSLQVTMTPVPSPTPSKNLYAIFSSDKVPAELVGRKLTDDQLAMLDCNDPEALRKALSTIEDVVAWFDLQDFTYVDGSSLIDSSEINCGFYMSASDMLSERLLGTDSISIAAMWLLQDDYPESGIVMAVSKSGPNCNAGYFSINEQYYILNFAPLIHNTASKPRWNKLDSLVMDDKNSLSDLLDKDSQQSEFISLEFISELKDMHIKPQMKFR